MLEAETVQAALLAAAGEMQLLVNHLGLAARSAPATRVVFESDLRAALRRALQFGRAEAVAVQVPLGKSGVLTQPTDVVVPGRTKTPQLAIELRWHPRGEDHPAFAQAVIGGIAKMAVARSRDAVDQAAVLVGAPSRFWRWVPGYSEDRAGYELLNPAPSSPVSTKSEFLAGAAWDGLFDGGMDHELPERLWSSLLDAADIRSPWSDLELRLLEAKGLGSLRAVRAAA